MLSYINQKKGREGGRRPLDGLDGLRSDPSAPQLARSNTRHCAESQYSFTGGRRRPCDIKISLSPGPRAINLVMQGKGSKKKKTEGQKRDTTPPLTPPPPPPPSANSLLPFGVKGKTKQKIWAKIKREKRAITLPSRRPLFLHLLDK